MYNCFGIEVARNSLIEEFSEVLESTGSINHRHITILVDNMTSKGMLIPIDRHGVKKNDIGPLSRATFEETVDQLMKAAAFGEEDTMRGVSANIMMGQIAPCGTGVMDVMLDEEKLFTFNIKNINKSNQNDINDDIIPEDKIGNCFKQLTTYKYPFDKIQTPVELPLMNDKYIQNLENKFK
jgi:DNA-directed RNA polymerase beta' subunit